jgi:hypothetical protein
MGEESPLHPENAAKLADAVEEFRRNLRENPPKKGHLLDLEERVKLFDSRLDLILSEMDEIGRHRRTDERVRYTFNTSLSRLREALTRLDEEAIPDFLPIVKDQEIDLLRFPGDESPDDESVDTPVSR